MACIFAHEVPGAMTQGETLEEARENIKDAIKLILEPVSLPELKSIEPINETIYVLMKRKILLKHLKKTMNVFY